MSVDRAARHQLHRRLAAVLGPEEADTFMAIVPSQDPMELVTKTDLDASIAAVRNDMEQFRHETQSEFAAVRQEMASEFAAVRLEMRTEFALVRGEMATMEQRLLATVHQEFASSTRTMVFSLVATVASIAGLALFT